MKEGWEAKKLVEICKIQYGYPFDSKQFCDDIKYPQLIRIRDVSRGYSETYYSGEIPEGYYVDKGDYLIGMDGEFNIAAWNSERALLNQRVCKILSNEEANDRFLYYNLRIILKQIEDETPFVTVKHLSAKRLNAVTINLPTLSEQQYIAEELDLLSSIIEKKKAQLNELDNLAQSLFYEMFGNIEDSIYEIKTLNDICEFIKDGTHQTPRYTEDKENGVKFLSAKDVVGGYVNWDNIKFIPFALHEELYKRIAPQRNDILLCKNGTTGIAAIVETDEVFDIYVSLALLRPRKPFCPYYILYAINNPITKAQFDSSLKGIGVPNLHLGEIKKTKIVYPPLDQQNLFAEKVLVIEHQKEFIKQSIKEVETLFNSRMDYYFN